MILNKHILFLSNNKGATNLLPFLFINMIPYLKILNLIAIVGCSEGETPPKLQLPTNLITQISYSSTVEGRIDIVATAKNANFYTFYFEDGDNTETLKDSDGKANHTYYKSGTYYIQTKAHVSNIDFIEKWDTVKIELSENNNGIPSKGYTTPLTYPNYTLVWQDEFEGETLNSKNWNFEIGTGSWGWGNNELQYYLQRNTTVKDGILTIEAKEEKVDGSNYTSSRITTKGKQSFKYGRIDIRAALPFGQGIWPAFWMLGDNISSVGWPKCGEIDIMEMVGGTSTGNGDNKVHGTLHWFENGERKYFGNYTKLNSGKFSDEFHVFSIIWDAENIKWFVDDKLFHTQNITSAEMTEFHEQFFLIFNIAVGGNWPGSPDSSTTFSQKMYVDYIRAFQ